MSEKQTNKSPGAARLQHGGNATGALGPARTQPRGGSLRAGRRRQGALTRPRGRGRGQRRAPGLGRRVGLGPRDGWAAAAEPSGRVGWRREAGESLESSRLGAGAQPRAAAGCEPARDPAAALRRAQLLSPGSACAGRAALPPRPAPAPRRSAVPGRGAGSRTLLREPFRCGVGGRGRCAIEFARVGFRWQVCRLGTSAVGCRSLMRGWYTVLKIAQLVFMFPSNRRFLNPWNIRPVLSGSGLGFQFPPPPQTVNRGFI